MELIKIFHEDEESTKLIMHLCFVNPFEELFKSNIKDIITIVVIIISIIIAAVILFVILKYLYRHYQRDKERNYNNNNSQMIHFVNNTSSISSKRVCDTPGGGSSDSDKGIF
jgi:beta-lactamase regulating signal transducer with metallopeptidase domain